MDIQSTPFIRDDYWPSQNELDEINKRIDNVESDLALNTASLQLSINNVSDNLNAYKDEQADTSISNNIIVNDINANYAKGKYGNFQNISSDNIVTNNLQVVKPITGVTLTDSAVINPHITGGIIENVSITNVNLGQFVELNDVNVKNLNILDGLQVDDICSSNVNSVNVNADFGNIKNIKSNDIDIVNASIDNASIHSADIISLDVTSSVIGNIVSDNIVANNIDVLNIQVEELTVNEFRAPVNAFIEGLAFNTMNGSGINALGVNADIISANRIITSKSEFNDVNISNAIIDNLQANNALFENVKLNINEEPVQSSSLLGYDETGRIIPVGTPTYTPVLPNNADYIFTDQFGTTFAGKSLNNMYEQGDTEALNNRLVAGSALRQTVDFFTNISSNIEKKVENVSNDFNNDLNNIRNDLNNVFVNDIESLNVNSINVNYININSKSEVNFYDIHISNTLSVDKNITSDKIFANEMNISNGNVANCNVVNCNVVNLNSDNIKANNITKNGKSVSTVNIISDNDYNNLSDSDKNSFYITYPSGNMHFCGLEFAPSFVPKSEYSALVDYNGTGITNNVIQNIVLLNNFDGYTKEHNYVDIIKYQFNSFWDNSILPNVDDACIFSNENIFATNINVRFNILNYDGSGVYRSILSENTSNLSLFDNLKRISFKNCNNLNTVCIPQSVTNLYASFENCKSLQIVYNGIHDGVVNMSRAFYNTPKLNATFFIPDSVQDLSYAFYMHRGNTVQDFNALNITGMNGVTNASYSFAYSSPAIAPYCPDNVIDASGMYYNGRTLNNVNIHIGNKVENAAKMFGNCRELNFNNTDLVIPENVRNAYYMFDTCGLYYMNQVYIYSNHFDNMDGIFNNCLNLDNKTIHIKSEIPLDESNYIYNTLKHQTTVYQTTLNVNILNDL